MPIVHPIPDMSTAELTARVTNYEEAIDEAVTLIKAGDPQAAAEMLQAILGADGQAHLRTIRDFEQLIAAVLAFKDRVLTTLTKDGCVICGGVLGTHVENCLVSVAISLQPDMLPQVEATAYETLVTLHTHLTRAAAEMDPEGRDYLISAMAACPIPPVLTNVISQLPESS
jgi:hypothetical protein